jgi:hypothetical protein
MRTLPPICAVAGSSSSRCRLSQIGAFCARVLLCAFRARHAYRRRRDLLLHALTGRFPRLQVSGAAAACNCCCRCPARPTTPFWPKPQPPAASASPRCHRCTWPDPRPQAPARLRPPPRPQDPRRRRRAVVGTQPGRRRVHPPAAARHVADQPGDPPRLEVRQPAIRSDRADMWPGLPTATNTARPKESFGTNRKLTSRDSCPLSAVLVRPVRVAYIRILAAWRCCGSSDMTARPPVSWGTPDPRRGRAVLLAGRDAVRPRLTSLRPLCWPWLRACRRRAESRPAASCRRRPGC